MARSEFQKQVAKGQEIGVPGDKATSNPFVYTDRNYLAGAGGVTVGAFVWDDPSNPAAPEPGTGVSSALSKGAGAPLGIVERNISYFNFDMRDGGTLAVPEESAIQVVIKGDLYAVSATAATKGQKVFAVLADGSLKTGAKGATIT
jgi:hypothetical protein